MDDTSPRDVLDRLIREKGTSYGALSALLGRNSAYIQQYVKRGTPRKLDEEDRRRIARFLGVEESLLGGRDGGVPAVRPALTAGNRKYPPGRELVVVPRLPLGASAGAGSLDEDEAAADAIAFSPRWLRDLGGRPDSLSIIRVDGESMAPTLGHGDDIMVDRSDGADRLRDGIYVLRLDDALMVKRVAMTLRRDRFSVRSDNPAYPDWDDVDPDSVAIVGRVIWAGRRMG
ncbi:S24 family peptidase [Sphingobium sufflavum]|uniref:S24 family peptidase n=1 Tax=Sphingobium sufflavum TaxID=1129547 RepID=UPI001F31D392|nr:S24 family peptidase [Sphingobium sufflavum]MCE7797709.1 S24 family peptidase [Sphingobium sufflavum]